MIHGSITYQNAAMPPAAANMKFHVVYNKGI